MTVATKVCRQPLFLAALLVAGCLGPNEEPPSLQGAQPIPEESYANLPFLETDHDHADPTLHQGAAFGLSLAAHLPLLEDRGAGYFGEMDVMGDLLALATEMNDGGVALVDVSDPDHPSWLSHILLDSAIVTDVKFAADAKTLFVGTASWATQLALVDRMDDGQRTAFGLSHALGVLAYDVSDPATPVLITYLPVGRDGVHMLDVHVIDETTWVFATTPLYGYIGAAQALLPTGSPLNGIEILRWDGALTRVAAYDAPEKVGADFAHDMTVVDDADQVLLLAGYSDHATIADVSDPTRPQHLGSFSLSANGIDSNVHTVMMQRVGDRRILVTTPEQFRGGEVLLLDATDPAHITPLGRWGLPGWEDRSGLAWSPHNVNLLDGKAYLAHYHGGAWVLDVSTDAAVANPEAIAYYAHADLDRPANTMHAYNYVYNGESPSTWEVIPAKGRVFVADMASGLYVLKPTWPVGDAPPYGGRGA